MVQRIASASPYCGARATTAAVQRGIAKGIAIKIGVIEFTNTRATLGARAMTGTRGLGRAEDIAVLAIVAVVACTDAVLTTIGV